MSSSACVHIDLPEPDDTVAVASRIAPHLHAGDCVLLTGTLGAGKTHFARSVIQARLADNGLWEDVPSPTYTLVQTYDDTVCEIWHADLYRLSNPTELTELGLEDALGSAITLVEWPDRLGDLAPESALQITLEMHGEGRRLIATWDDPRIVHLSEPNV